MTGSPPFPQTASTRAWSVLWFRDEFVQQVFEETKITDPILDWLRTAVFRIARKRAPAIDRRDSSGSDGDESDTLGEESSEDEDPLLEQPDLSCGSDTIVNSNKEKLATVAECCWL